MLTFRKADWDDKEYDNCGRPAVAVLEIDNIVIPLCFECLDNLNRDLNEYNNTIFCYKCSEFVMNKYGWRYGGSCKKEAEKCGNVITDENAGYDCFVDCMKTCKEAKLREQI